MSAKEKSSTARFTTNGKKAEMQFSHSKNSVFQFRISDWCT